MYRSMYKFLGSKPVSKGDRAGQKWTTEEDQQLSLHLANKLPYEEISTLLARTETAVKMRAIANAISTFGQENIDKIAEGTNLSVEVINDIIKNKKEVKHTSENDKNDTRVLFQFKAFLKKKGEFTNKMDELFDEFMLQK